jgi:hypothetical protein
MNKINNNDDLMNEDYRGEFDIKFISFLTLVYFVLMIFTLFFYNQNQF